ncbi:MAG: hypothetical protein VYA71_04325 [Pseudomonadota bacterium]|nr:hypothetical protein [Pseudomonadota bacterium]
MSPCVTFDKTSMTYKNLNMMVRDLPEDHDSADLIAAMSEACDTDNPALGVFYKEDRATLGDNLDDIARAAGGLDAAAE